MTERKLTRSQSLWNVLYRPSAPPAPTRSNSVAYPPNTNLLEGKKTSKSFFGRFRKHSGDKKCKGRRYSTCSGPCLSGDVDAVDSSGRSLLFYAARYGQLDVATQLIQAGCSPNQQDVLNNTPLHEAIEKGHFKIAEVFLEEGLADVNMVGFNGQTPLMAAVTRGQIDALKFLDRYSADVNICDALGNSPIYCALQRGWCEIADFLLDCRCDVNKRTTNGMTCFFAAAHNDKIDAIHIAKRLLHTDYDFKMDADWLSTEGCPFSDRDQQDKVLVRAGLMTSKRKHLCLIKGTRKFLKTFQRCS